jgi:hypothetical protein
MITEAMLSANVTRDPGTLGRPMLIERSGAHFRSHVAWRSSSKGIVVEFFF